MNKVLSKIFSFLKYVLLILAFAVTLFGIINTYKRLDKPILDAIPVFVPFLLVFILFIINIFVKKAKIGENLLLNFTAVVLFVVIIIIGIRAKFDTNMLLYYKYKIDYNPLYFSDNLSSVKIVLYCLSISNIFFLLKAAFEDGKEMEVVKEEIKDKKEDLEEVVDDSKIVLEEKKSEDLKPKEEVNAFETEVELKLTPIMENEQIEEKDSVEKL